jgi:plasmid stability protein
MLTRAQDPHAAFRVRRFQPLCHLTGSRGRGKASRRGRIFSEGVRVGQAASVRAPPRRRPPRGASGPQGRACHERVDMRCTCTHAWHMTTMIQIRNVPDALHRRLKSRAALAGMSLSDYLLSEIRQVAGRPTLEELRARLEQRPGVTPTVKPAQAVRAERDRHDRR